MPSHFLDCSSLRGVNRLLLKNISNSELLGLTFLVEYRFFKKAFSSSRIVCASSVSSPLDNFNLFP